MNLEQLDHTLATGAKIISDQKVEQDLQQEIDFLNEERNNTAKINLTVDTDLALNESFYDLRARVKAIEDYIESAKGYGHFPRYTKKTITIVEQKPNLPTHDQD